MAAALQAETEMEEVEGETESLLADLTSLNDGVHTDSSLFQALSPKAESHWMAYRVQTDRVDTDRVQTDRVQTDAELSKFT